MSKAAFFVLSASLLAAASVYLLLQNGNLKQAITVSLVEQQTSAWQQAQSELGSTTPMFLIFESELDSFGTWSGFTSTQSFGDGFTAIEMSTLSNGNYPVAEAETNSVRQTISSIEMSNVHNPIAMTCQSISQSAETFGYCLQSMATSYYVNYNFIYYAENTMENGGSHLGLLWQNALGQFQGQYGNYYITILKF